MLERALRMFERAIRRDPCDSNNEKSMKGLIKIRKDRIHSNHADQIMNN